MKKNWTKILIAVLTLAMILSLTGCPGDTPEETKPEGTPEATPTNPAPTDPAPTDPAPTDPAPTDPAPTDPAPTDPAPTDPAPTDPAPTDPVTPPVVDTLFDNFYTINDEITAVEGKSFVDNGTNEKAPFAATETEGFVAKGENGAEITLLVKTVAKATITFTIKVTADADKGAYVTLNGNQVDEEIAVYTAGTHYIRVDLTPGQICKIAVGIDEGTVEIGAATIGAWKDPTPEGPEGPARSLVMATTVEDLDFDFDNALTIEVEAKPYSQAGAAAATKDGVGYMYIKRSAADPHVKIKFKLDKAGTYDFIIATFSTVRNNIPSTGLVQIDQGAKHYLKAMNTFQGTEYSYGLTATLEAGEHYITFYLADDFDDKTVKSIYWDKVIIAESTGGVELAPELKEEEVVDNTPKIPSTMVGVRLDAIKDQAYTGEEILINTAWSGNPADYTGTGAKAWLVWDGTGIYVYAEVNDATPDSSAGLDAGDKFQVYIDVARDSAAQGLTEGDYKKTGTAGSKRLGWINCKPDGTAGGSWGWSGVAIQGATRTIEGGYALEYYIPLDTSIIPADSVIGFSMAFHDDTDGDKNRNAIFFSPDATDYWNSYEKIPGMKLAEVKELPETERSMVKAATAPTIDGDKDAVYGTGYELAYRWTGSTADAEGQTTVYMTYDAENLYIFADITDKTANSMTDGNIAVGDKIQVYIDFVNADNTVNATGGYHGSAKANYGLGTVGYVEVARDGENQRKMYAFNDAAFTFTSAGKEKADGTGYTLEMAIPFDAATKASLARGAMTTIAVGFQVNDDVDGISESPDDGREGIYVDFADGMSYWSSYALCPEYRLA